MYVKLMKKLIVLMSSDYAYHGIKHGIKLTPGRIRSGSSSTDRPAAALTQAGLQPSQPSWAVTRPAPGPANVTTDSEAESRRRLCGHHTAARVPCHLSFSPVAGDVYFHIIEKRDRPYIKMQLFKLILQLFCFFGTGPSCSCSVLMSCPTVEYPTLENMDYSSGKRVGRALRVLTDEKAIEIYCCKLSLIRPDSFKSSLQGTVLRTKGQSARIAAQYGVSPKTIRDIWNRRTWSCTTAHLWHEEKDWEIQCAQAISQPTLASPCQQSRTTSSINAVPNTQHDFSALLRQSASSLHPLPIPTFQGAIATSTARPTSTDMFAASCGSPAAEQARAMYAATQTPKHSLAIDDGDAPQWRRWADAVLLLPPPPPIDRDLPSHHAESPTPRRRAGSRAPKHALYPRRLQPRASAASPSHGRFRRNTSRAR
jgi:hypothetical protein